MVPDDRKSVDDELFGIPDNIPKFSNHNTLDSNAISIVHARACSKTSNEACI